MSKRRTRPKQANRLPLEGTFPEHLHFVADQLAGSYSYVDELDRGKNGIACKLSLIANPQHFVCLKTIRPDIDDGALRKKVGTTLRSEVAILSPLSHKSLPTILERNLEGESPYYVCTYHPGQTFRKFRDAGHRLDFHQALFALWSLLDVVAYLHDHGRTHCDLHDNNAMISTHVFRDGIMVIDFGSGHRDSAQSPETSNRGNVNFKTVAGQTLDRQRVNRRASQLDFQSADFNAIGKLLAIMRDCFMHDAPVASQNAYDDFAAALQTGMVDGWRQVHALFTRVVDPYRVVTQNSRLFLSAAGQPQTIPMPAGQDVAVGEGPLRVINVVAFQRLRGIKQLSFCDWHFPGANHSRFEHSIGVFGIAKRAIDHLVHDSQFRELFTPLEVRGFLLAALIHDIGHYPFAHVVEQYAASRFPDSTTAREAVSHQHHGLALIDGDVELSSAIRASWGEDALGQAIKTIEGQVPVLSELLDGPIDVDKIDYLVRDAVHCGMAFGKGLDVDGLLAAYRCVGDGKHLGIAESGISATEGLMVLQDQMLSSVYWHEAVRGIICMFHAILAYVVRRNEAKLKSIVADLQKCSSDRDALAIVIKPAVAASKGPERAQLSRLVDLYMTPRYTEIYRPICVYRATDQAPQGKPRQNIYNCLVVDKSHTSSLVPIEWQWVAALRDAFISAFKEKSIEMEALHLVVDVPYGKDARRMVQVKGSHGRPDYDITNVSHLNRSIFERPAAFLSPVRIYVAPAMCERAGNRLQSIVIAAEERFYEGTQERAEGPV